jgi:pimeloyl-ACP methyl ester carboxylesterase
MTALYRCGRQADALAAYQRARELLVSELGLEPGGELQRVEGAILRHDPALAAPTPAGVPADSIIRSPVRYARSTGDVSVAYDVAGDGPVDVLAIPGFIHHLDIWWNAPTDRLVRGLTSLGRLIVFDKRGMGLSDRPDAVAIDDWVDDALAVLDTVGSKRPIVLGIAAGALTALTLAARHPDRVGGLMLYGGFARQLAAPGYDMGFDRELVESFAANLEARWGAGGSISFFAPSRAQEPGVRQYWARYQQLSASPAAAMRFFWTTIEADVRDLLPGVSVPTLVLHAERDQAAPIAQGRYVAERIPGAEMVTFDSDIHLMCLSDVMDDMTAEMSAFIQRTVALT